MMIHRLNLPKPSAAFTQIPMVVLNGRRTSALAPSQESTLSTIAIEYQVVDGGDSGVPALAHTRLTLDGEDIQPTTYIPMPELAALKPFEAHVDHEWFDTCVVKKSLIQIGPAEERPTFIEPRNSEQNVTLEICYESSTANVSYRILRSIDTDSIHLAYLEDNIWYAQKRAASHRHSPAEGDIWIIEHLNGVEPDCRRLDVRKTQILETLRRQYRKSLGELAYKEALNAFTGPGVLVADPTTGMLIWRSDRNHIWLFSFWRRWSFQFHTY
jgi:hypothetical protein